MSVDFMVFADFRESDRQDNFCNGTAAKIVAAAGLDTSELMGYMTAEQAEHAANVLSGETSVFFEETPSQSTCSAPRILSGQK